MESHFSLFLVADNEDKDSDISEALLSKFLFPSNPFINSALLDQILQLDIDEDTLLSLILIHERHLDGKSHFHKFISQLYTYSDPCIHELMGDQKEDIISYFEEEVLPQLGNLQGVEQEIFYADSFLWAACILETHGVSLNSRLIGLIPDNADMETRVDARDAANDSFPKETFGIFF